MILLVRGERPADVVVASGVSRSVRELCEVAYGHVGLDWREHVQSDPALRRPADIDVLVGDPSAAEALGWRREVSFDDMIGRMVDAAVVAAGA
jgi:GDPmannose 4,6-dehydratase